MTAKSPVAIVISRQMGAGGAELGQRLARRLGYVYLDRAILQMVADRIGITDAELEHWDEQVSRFWDRLAETFARGSLDVTYSPPPLSSGVRDRNLFQLESEVIREAASLRNVVVIGRCGFHVLRDHPRLVSVLLHAPLAARIPRVMRARNLTDKAEATVLIERTDAERERFLRLSTGETPGDARCYHLCINTGRVGLDIAEEAVAKLVERV
jgi:cytidylate kinase